MKNTTSLAKTQDLFSESYCLNGYLHRYKLAEQYTDGVVEMCEVCKDRYFFRVVDGRIDNNEYLSKHARQALMKQHPLFSHEYDLQ